MLRNSLKNNNNQIRLTNKNFPPFGGCIFVHCVHRLISISIMRLFFENK